MQRRTLSSRLTFIAKFVVSPFFVLVALLVVLLLSNSFRKTGGAGSPGFGIWVFMMLWFAVVALFVRRFITWKRVKMDTSNLYISNYFKEIQVPLNQISAVSERRWSGPPTVTIQLRQPTEFGQAIRFNPRLEPRFWREHPVVTELRQIASGVVVTPEQLARAMTGDRWRLVIIIGLFLTFFMAIMLLVETIFRRSDPYALGLSALTQDAAVIQALGEPLKPGLFIGGNISEQNEGGCAAMDFSLRGPRAQGDAHVNAIKTEGIWHLTQVWIELPVGAQKIEVVNTPITDGEKRCAIQSAQ
jgi:hypothetical protein